MSIGICPQCQKNPVEPNRHSCYECLGRERDRYYERRKNGKLQKKLDQDSQRKKIEYNRRKKSGLCTTCGKKQKQNGLLCASCYVKYRSKAAKKRQEIDRSERVSYGMCYICGANELYENHHVCRKCYQVRQRTLPAMWSNMNNEYFKSQNNLEYAMRRR